MSHGGTNVAVSCGAPLYNSEPKKGVLSLNKKDDASNSVFRFEAALTAVETEFVSLSVQSFLGDMKAAVKVNPKFDRFFLMFYFRVWKRERV